MDKRSLKRKIEGIIKELIKDGKADLFGEIKIEIVDIDTLALVKGNKIYFSVKVKDLPDRALKYIIAHELAHLIVKKHTAKFWEIVKNLYPDYEKGKDELNKILNSKTFV